MEKFTAIDFCDLVELYFGIEKATAFSDYIKRSYKTKKMFKVEIIRWEHLFMGLTKPQIIKLFQIFKVWINNRTQAKKIGWHIAARFNLTREELGCKKPFPF